MKPSGVFQAILLYLGVRLFMKPSGVFQAVFLYLGVRLFMKLAGAEEACLQFPYVRSKTFYISIHLMRVHA